MTPEETDMELTKFGSTEVAYHIKHDLRELSKGKIYGNAAIDPSLSCKNYNLVNRGNHAAEVNGYRRSVEKELFKYNRKNLIHAIEVVIQCPDDCAEEQKEAFFEESYRYICSTLPMGEKCVFIASVHKDEKHYAPDGELLSKDHLHIMYVPAAPDTKHEGYEYKLCADVLTKRARMKELHPGLQEHLDQKGIKATVYRKKEGGEKTIPFTVKQLKEFTEKTGIKLKKSVTIDELIKIISDHIKSKEEMAEKILSQKDDIDLLKKEIREKDEIISKLKSIENKVEWGISTDWGKQGVSSDTLKEREK